MKFAQTHEWIRLEDNVGTIGITKHAKDELGEIVYVELPKVGSIIQKGEEISVLESTKAAADIYAPVSGKILAVHKELGLSPHMINQAPESEGWICQIELSNPDEVKLLLSQEEYRRFLQQGGE